MEGSARTSCGLMIVRLTPSPSVRARSLAAAALAAAFSSPLAAQAASPRALGPLGAADAWHCTDKSEPMPVPLPAPVMMVFTLLTPSVPSPADSTRRLPVRIITVGFSHEGELLVFSEIVLDSTASPRIQMPRIRREAKGVYSGLRVGGGPLSDTEVAMGVELARELWRRRCVGPRA